MAIADTNNTALWEEVYTTAVDAERPYPNRYIPIKEILCPVVLDRPLIAAYVGTNKPVTFRSGGWMSKNVSIGVTVGNNMNTKADWSRRLMLDQTYMILWENFNQSYKVKFSPYKQLDHVIFRLWQFTGEISQLSDEQISALRIDVLRLEKMLQFIASRDVPTIYNVDFEQ